MKTEQCEKAAQNVFHNTIFGSAAASYVPPRISTKAQKEDTTQFQIDVKLRSSRKGGTVTGAGAWGWGGRRGVLPPLTSTVDVDVDDPRHDQHPCNSYKQHRRKKRWR